MKTTAALRELLGLLEKATPGEWRPDPKRLKIPTAHGVVEGPIMSYLVGNKGTAAGMTVSVASERIADHEAIAASVNFLREHGPELLTKLRDAERYRWIRDTFNVADPSDDPESAWSQAWDTIELGQVDGRIAAQLDDAIDAALGEKDSARAVAGGSDE